MLTGFRIYEKIEDEDFFNIKELDEGNFLFSILTTALNYGELTKFFGLKSAEDPKIPGLETARLKEFSKWAFEETTEGRTRLGESRNLKQLNKIVSNKSALKAWRDGASLELAAMYTETPTQIFTISVMEARDKLFVARDYSHQVEKPEASTVEVLVEIRKISTDLHTLLSNKA